ncbi:MAG: hypothetical protein JXR52_02785 [Bacteroidales bacterium]|nr:hypothetical protein [Bacteroidales bacterium]MBN2697726.1 hypothetical protein [Bacteroidales bacterium]
MKKLNVFLALILLGFAGIFFSCETEEALGPTLEFFGGEYIDENVTVEPGADLKFSWLATKGDANLKSFSITRDGVTLDGYPDEDIENDNYSDQVTLIAPLNEGAYVYVFKVTDNGGLSDEVSITVTVEQTGGPILEWTQTLGSHQSNTGSSFASTNGQVYSLAEAKANATLIDFMYFYGATNLATLAAPDDPDITSVFFSADGPESWTTRNSTRFIKTNLTTAQFDEVADDLLIVANAEAANLTKVNELEANDVIAFVTDSDKEGGEKLGLIKIASINEGAGGDIQIVVKVQQ